MVKSELSSAVFFIIFTAIRRKRRTQDSLFFVVDSGDTSREYAFVPQQIIKQSSLDLSSPLDTGSLFCKWVWQGKIRDERLELNLRRVRRDWKINPWRRRRLFETSKDWQREKGCRRTGKESTPLRREIIIQPLRAFDRQGKVPSGRNLDRKDLERKFGHLKVSKLTKLAASFSGDWNSKRDRSSRLCSNIKTLHSFESRKCNEDPSISVRMHRFWNFRLKKKPRVRY